MGNSSARVCSSAYLHTHQSAALTNSAHSGIQQRALQCKDRPV